MNTIYIVTRTSGRPNAFLRCIESTKVLSSIFNVVNIVTYDDVETKEYVERANILRGSIVALQVDKVFSSKGGEFPYNLYINTAHAYICEVAKENEGWVMYLDDDDYILDDLSVSLSDDIVLTGGLVRDALYMWRTEFPDSKVRPTDRNWGKNIGNNDAPSSSFMYNTNYLLNNREKLSWTGRRGGDYRMLSGLFRISKNKRWINVVGTCVEKEGWGKREDVVRNAQQNKLF